jgi:signal transduction histidine kinase
LLVRYWQNHYEIAISDEGIGIPKAEQKHLFERFFRASNAGNIQGTGLGLNIVKRYVELLHGEINFTSEEGKGTTFTLSFPYS